MNEETPRLKHAIVGIGVNTAEMPEEYLRDSRILFLGPSEAWKAKQQDNVRVIIRTHAIPHKHASHVEDAIQDMKVRVRNLRTMTLTTSEKVREAIALELKELEPTAPPPKIVPGAVSEYASHVVPATEEHTSPETVSETSAVAPLGIRRRSRSQIVRDVFEEALGDSAKIYEKVLAEYPDASRVSVSQLTYQARRGFEETNPDLLARIAAVKAARNGHVQQGGAVNGHFKEDPIPVLPALNASGAESPSPSLKLSRGLRAIHEALQGVVDMFPPLIDAVEKHEKDSEVVEGAAVSLMEQVQHMQKALDRLN